MLKYTRHTQKKQIFLALAMKLDLTINEMYIFTYFF